MRVLSEGRSSSPWLSTPCHLSHLPSCLLSVSTTLPQAPALLPQTVFKPLLIPPPCPRPPAQKVTLCYPKDQHPADDWLCYNEMQITCNAEFFSFLEHV